MTARVASRLAWTLWTAIMAIVVSALVLLVVVGFAAPAEGFAFPGFAAVLAVAFATVGAVIASRRPQNTIGWVFLASGFSAALQELAMAYSVLGQRTPLPGTAYAAWLADWIWLPYTGATLVVLFLTFPSGRLPGRHGVLVAALAAVGLLVAFAGEFLGSGPLGMFPSIDNPLVLLENEAVANRLAAAGFAVFALAAVLAVVGLGERWRQARGIERQQYKWLLASGALAGLALALGAADRAATGQFGTASPFLLELLLAVGLVSIPVSVGAAILRYRLYEIDRLVSRTVTYALVAGMLVAVYAGGVLLVGFLLPLQGELAVAASTLAVAALFSPLRRRVQAQVDRRFNRAHYDAEQAIRRLTMRLRVEMEVDELAGEVLGVVERTVQPTTASVWLRGRS